MQFQELSWMNGKRKPLNRSMLKMYIISMREVVEAYKKFLFELSRISSIRSSKVKTVS